MMRIHWIMKLQQCWEKTRSCLNLMSDVPCPVDMWARPISLGISLVVFLLIYMQVFFSRFVPNLLLFCKSNPAYLMSATKTADVFCKQPDLFWYDVLGLIWKCIKYCTLFAKDPLAWCFAFWVSRWKSENWDTWQFWDQNFEIIINQLEL